MSCCGSVAICRRHQLSACERHFDTLIITNLDMKALPFLSLSCRGLRKALSSCRKGRAWRWALVLLDDFEGGWLLVESEAYVEN